MTSRSTGRPRLGVTPVVGELLLTAFFVVEPRLRRGEQARSLTADPGDRGSTRTLAAATVVAGVGAPLLGLRRRGPLPAGAGWAGVALMAGGLGLRIWSARTLGAHYTRTLRVSAGQALVDTGPYARVRHPGYAGVLALWVGYGLTWRSGPALVAATAPVLPAYARRITAEEALLDDRFGAAYGSYRSRTARLVPGVW